jgi:hypothetical protein
MEAYMVDKKSSIDKPARKQSDKSHTNTHNSISKTPVPQAVQPSSNDSKNAPKSFAQDLMFAVIPP